MAVYRDDGDLRFLQHCDNERLLPLVSILTHDPKDNKPRYSETLTKSSGYQRYFHRGEHQAYWRDIAAEVQTYGAHSFVTLMRRGKGVLYREVLIDVCSKQKATINKKGPIEAIEQALLNKILTASLAAMSQSDLNQLAKELGVTGVNITPGVVVMGLQRSMMSNPGLWSSLIYQVLQALGFNVGRMFLTTVAPAFAPRTLPMLGILTGPVGWAISCAWLSSDIAGPAYRVTLPACLYIATLRCQYQAGLAEPSPQNGE